MQCLNTINGRFIECKISNYGSQCNKYCHDIIPSEFENITATAAAWTAVTQRWQGREYFRINEAFLHILPGKVSSAGQVHPSHPQICTSSFPHPASYFSHNHIQSFLRIQFFSKNIHCYVHFKTFWSWVTIEIILRFRCYSTSIKVHRHMCILYRRWWGNRGRKWVSLGPFICVT